MKFNVSRYFKVLGIELGVVMVIILGFLFNSVFGITDMLFPKEQQVTSVEARGDGVINCLVMGVDADDMHTDVIMIASFNLQSQQLKLLSIPRDTRMYVGNRYQKINAAHALGAMEGKIIGAEGTLEAVNRLTNIPIDYYVEFNFDAIDHFMDILGPVTFTVPDVYGDGVGMKYDDPVQNLHINLKPGTQELSGNQIQQLLRYRKENPSKKYPDGRSYPNGDTDRIKMQQQFFEALVDQKINLSLVLKLPAIFEQMQKDIKTNITVKDVTKYMSSIKGFTSDKITAYSLPGESQYVESKKEGELNTWYFVCDMEKAKQMITDEFGYDASNITIDKAKSKDDKATAKPTAKSGAKSTAKATAKPTAKAAGKTPAKSTKQS